MDDDEDGEEPGRVKWLPFFRNFGMVSSFSGIGPEKIMFSTFKSSRGRSPSTSSVPVSLLFCTCSVERDPSFAIVSGSLPVRLFDDRSLQHEYNPRTIDHK